MVNIEDMLSPSGGSDNGNRINTGLAGLLGFVAFGLPDKVSPFTLLMGPGAERYHIDKEVDKANRSPLRRTAAENRAQHVRRRSAIERAHYRNNLYGPAMRGTPYSADRRAAANAKVLYGRGTYTSAAGTKSIRSIYGSIQDNLREVSSSLRANVAGVRAQYAAGRRIVKGLGWAFAGSFALDVGFSVFTPQVGVSASALRADERMMYSPPMDSGMAATGRKRALQAIFDSQSSIRNVIGSEAQYYHS